MQYCEGGDSAKYGYRDAYLSALADRTPLDLRNRLTQEMLKKSPRLMLAFPVLVPVLR